MLTDSHGRSHLNVDLADRVPIHEHAARQQAGQQHQPDVHDQGRSECHAGQNEGSTPTKEGKISRFLRETHPIDKTLDLAEVKAAASAHFDELNKDGDSTLETKEVQGIIGAKAFKAADPDNDGSLSKDEYLALVEKVFKKADPDNDGTLDAKELQSKSGIQLRKLIG